MQNFTKHFILCWYQDFLLRDQKINTGHLLVLTPTHPHQWPQVRAVELIYREKILTVRATWYFSQGILQFTMGQGHRSNSFQLVLFSRHGISVQDMTLNFDPVMINKQQTSNNLRISFWNTWYNLGSFQGHIVITQVTIWLFKPLTRILTSFQICK